MKFVANKWWTKLARWVLDREPTKSGWLLIQDPMDADKLRLVGPKTRHYMVVQALNRDWINVAVQNISSTLPVSVSNMYRLNLDYALDYDGQGRPLLLWWRLEGTKRDLHTSLCAVQNVYALAKIIEPLTPI